MRLVSAIFAVMVAIGAIAQDVIDVHSHIITPGFLSALRQENRLMDEEFPCPTMMLRNTCDGWTRPV